jgi:NNP family nitrate/nitrite transporter-like MFS transporter
MFPVVSFATIVPVLFLGLVGYRSLTALLIGGFFLGVAGTSFAVGVPFVNAWFPAGRRGWPPASSAWAWAGPRSAP